MTSLYLDHNATAPIRPETVEAVAAAAAKAGNPSSVHRLGQAARHQIHEAKRAVRRLVGASRADVILTSGGTEADNLAISGLAQAQQKQTGAKIVIFSDLEHPAVRDSVARLEARGFVPRRVRVDPDGRVDLDVFPAPEELRNTALIALMLANNETGVIQPVEAVSAVARAAGVPLHVDAVQAAGKIAIDFDALQVDTLALSAHKFGGPRGVGALVTGPEVKLEPLWQGGLQQGGLRPGTEAVALAAGMAAAAAAALADLEHHDVGILRDRLEQSLVARLADAGISSLVLGASAPRLPNTCAIAFAGVQGQALVRCLDEQGIGIGAGAACHGDSVRVSGTLAAMGIPAQRAVEMVRISLGWTTTAEEIDRAIDTIVAAVRELRG